MKLRLVDKTTYDIIRAEVINGRLEIDFRDKTAEEVQTIFSVPANIETIELLTDTGEMFSNLVGWSKYGGVILNGETKTAIITQVTDVTEKRITSAESNAIAAKAATQEQKVNIEEIEQANNVNAQQITDLQLALCEIYEGMEV